MLIDVEYKTESFEASIIKNRIDQYLTDMLDGNKDVNGTLNVDTFTNSYI